MISGADSWWFSGRLRRLENHHESALRKSSGLFEDFVLEPEKDKKAKTEERQKPGGGYRNSGRLSWIA
jgi:hypothetical protein